MSLLDSAVVQVTESVETSFIIDLVLQITGDLILDIVNINYMQIPEVLKLIVQIQ